MYDLFVILLVIGIGILCFLTGDMTAFIALAATLVIGLGLAGILYYIYKSKQRRMEKYNPLPPTLRWMNAAGSIPDCRKLTYKFSSTGWLAVQ